jgi:hypothetical protein
MWIDCFKNIRPRYAIYGKEPRRFGFKDNSAMISADEGQAQSIVDSFKQWIEKANAAYAKRVGERQRGEEIGQKQQLELEILEEEKRERILKKLTM